MYLLLYYFISLVILINKKSKIIHEFIFDTAFFLYYIFSYPQFYIALKLNFVIFNKSFGKRSCSSFKI